ncbi:hypothetical protein AA313_de0201015 [Arthrobotrys entomopaga]|nr:hypothetical protein AA313_de0201015 [Arthrobotrys entomopaga]
MSSDDIDPLSLLWNTSFNLHKLTPLNLNGALTSQTNLKSHSTRLTNILRGDVLRGVRVAESQNEDAPSRTGALKKVKFTTITIHGGELSAVAILFLYEKITYSAFLVQSSSADVPPAATSSRRASLRRATVQGNSNYYPLLLTRLPAWLQSRFLEYLVENFDCHVSNLRLPDGFIMKSIESALECYTPSGNGGSVGDAQPTKNLQIWLEPLPTISKDIEQGTKNGKLQTLKTISMTFTREDIPGLLYKGQELKGKMEYEDDGRGPFELALSLYAYHHMGIFVEKMRVSKAACAEFIAGMTADGSGKCKFFAPKAVERSGDGDVVKERQKGWDGMLGSLVGIAS